MRQSSDPAPGLRERKKARTRAAIQAHAVRLFQRQGYDETTVEQIADAAEVSPSTVWRYFPTKEDLVVTDDYAPMLVAAIARQPAGMSPLRALRASLRTTLAALPPGEIGVQRERVALTLSVPALWGASLRNLTTSMDLVAEAAAAREGLPADDPAIRTFSGAVFGVMIEVMFRWVREPELELAAELDRSLAHLEAGLPFPARRA